VDDLTRMLTAKPLNRRSFLAASGLGLSAAALAACSTGSSSPAPSGDASAPPAGDVEDELYVYNWSDYINPDNMTKFTEEFGAAITYDVFANNDELLAKLQGGASAYDIACPTAEYVPAMRDGGSLQKLDLSRIPNQQYINAAFKGLAWDPTDEWQLPKDYGTTGLLYRSKLVTDPLTSWKEFFELAKGKHSGKIVVVDSMGDVFTFPLKMLGYSLNSQDKDELEEARRILLELAPHVLALDSDLYGDKLASEEAAIALAWTGPIVELRADPDTADTMWVNPSEGTLFWLDTWVMLADAPHPNASYAWLDFIHRPEIQGDETNYNGYATPSDAAKEFVDPELLADPAIFPSDDVIAKLEGAEDTSGNTQRIEIWEEFKSAVGG
jgi:spermidine/putrescine transport system substrate-binding protein